MPQRYDLRGVATQMVALLPADALGDLQKEEPALAVEVYFPPVKVHKLITVGVSGKNCSVDGYYDRDIDPDLPRIMYSDSGGTERARFTIIHELGHHIFNTIGASLLDDLDRIASPTGDPAAVEEVACHRFAGEVLVPAHLLDDIIGKDPVTPRHVLQLHKTSQASWEALAVRAASHSNLKTAVALVRRQGEVSFVAANWWTSWPRGSTVKTGGPLDRALRSNSTTGLELFRSGLGGAEQMFCNTARVDERLAVAVLSSQASDGGISILKEVEPVWKTRKQFCEWCSEERSVDWCPACSGQLCPSCGRCGCNPPTQNPICPQCFSLKPFRPGAQMCRDCERDRD